MARSTAGDPRPNDAPSAEAPAESAAQALARAREHARRACAEALEALRALLDAVSLVTSGAPSESHRALSLVSHALESAAATLAPGGDPALVEALADALDQEIARWEQRAESDPDARAVLRAFLGVRELLWELGLRRTRSGGEPDEEPGGRDTPVRTRPRVQRVRVQG